jgi:hypothetical protein
MPEIDGNAGHSEKQDQDERHERERLSTLILPQSFENRIAVCAHWTISVICEVNVQLPKA